jgi:tetratricopeptide (TPR) repeat protein
MSRNSAMLWDEWANLLLTILQKPEQAYQKIERALAIDPEYHRSYALLGDYYLRKKSGSADGSISSENLQLAAQNYAEALSLPTPSEPAAKFNYAQILASIYSEMGRTSAAIDAYQQAIKNAPNGVPVWKIHEALADLYIQNGDTSNALLHLQYALSDAPLDQKERLRAIIAQFKPAGQP